MKRRVLISIALVIVLLLSGCNLREIQELIGSGNGNGQQTVVENSDSEEVSESGSTDAETDSQPEDSEAEPEAPESSLQYLDVTTFTEYDGYYDQVSLMYGHYGVLQLNSTEYPALTEAVEAYNAYHSASAQQYLDDLENWAIQDYAEYGEEMFMGAYSYEEDMYITRADSQVLSIAMFCQDYAGGAHGMTYYGAENFDTQTGEDILLEDVITDFSKLPEVITDELCVKYPHMEENYGKEMILSYLTEYVTPSNPDYAPQFTWSLGYEGVTFYFSSYEIAAYADGVQVVTVNYDKYPQLFNASYFNQVDDYYAVKLMSDWAGTNADIDLDNDGVTDYISVTRNYNTEYGTDFSESFDVSVNGNTFTHEFYCYDLENYLIKSGSDYYLYVKRRVENDYESFCVFKITGSSVEYVGECDGGFTSFTNSLDFGIVKRVDLLSTYSAVARCYVGTDGMPVEKDGAYQVENEMIITSTVDITADLVDEEGLLTGERYTFPAGTEFMFMSTDGETYVDMKTGEGPWCRLYTAQEWPPTVNGMDAESSFVMLWYAG